MSLVKCRQAFAILILLLGIDLSFSQEAQRTTAAYDDWLVSCTRMPEGQMFCELSHTQRMQGHSDPVGQIAVSRLNAAAPLMLSIITPANVWIDAGAKFRTEEGNSEIAASFRWCTNTRCLAEAELTNEMIDRLRHRSEPGKVDYKEATQRDVSSPVSFTGFAAALKYFEAQEKSPPPNAKPDGPKGRGGDRK